MIEGLVKRGIINIVKYSAIPVEHREQPAHDVILRKDPDNPTHFKTTTDCQVLIPRSNGGMTLGTLKYASVGGDVGPLFTVCFTERGDPKCKTLLEDALREANPTLNIVFEREDAKKSPIGFAVQRVQRFIASILNSKSED